MKYWKEKEINPVEKMDFWKGDYITKLEPNEVFVFGANPQARHFAGAAKAALSFGAVPINIKQNKPGIARGLSPNNKTYALITKSLEAGYTEAETGITYHKEGFQSVSVEQIRANVDQLYETAKKPEHLDKKFLITYQYEAWPNGTPKKSLNGYTSQEMLEMFAKDKEIPPNIIFHETYKPYLEKLFKKENKQSTGELVVYENDKTIDIKEEDIIWTIVEDERNPQGRHGAGAAKAAMMFGATYGKSKGMMGDNAYGLITKNLKAGITVDGVHYPNEGYKSVAPDQIRANIDELYQCAVDNPDKKFLITYQIDYWPNGSPKKSLNGYEAYEFLEMFVRDDIPPNIVFHDSYKPQLEKLLGQRMKQANTIQEQAVEYTYFFQATSPFSQWHPSKFTYKELDFICTEQFMMYAKAKTFGDNKVADKIMNIEKCFLSKDENKFGVINTLYGTFDNEQDKACYDLIQDFRNGRIDRNKIVGNYKTLNTWKAVQAVIKKLGREVSNYNEEVWVSKRTSVVSVANREKYNQNPDLKDILMATNDSIMVEASPYDKIWGIGLSEADAKKVHPSKWLGLNLLGKVLTDLKNYYRNEPAPPSKMKM